MNYRLAAMAAVSILAVGHPAGCTAETGTPAAPPAVPSVPPQSPATEAPTATPNPEERNAGALRAIATAAGAASGTAYEIDDEGDDNTWEVDVMAGDRSITVKVSGDGNTVVSQEDGDGTDLDSDRARLERSTVTLEQAIETALREVPGALDDVELDEGDGQDVWRVKVDTPENDDIEVYVLTTENRVLKVER